MRIMSLGISFGRGSVMYDEMLVRQRLGVNLVYGGVYGFGTKA